MNQRLAVFIPDTDSSFGEELLYLMDSFYGECKYMLLYRRDIECGVPRLPHCRADSFDEIRTWLKSEEGSGVSSVILFDNSFFGPVYPWKDILSNMDQQYDCWGLEYRETYMDSHGERHAETLKTHFLSVSRVIFLDMPLEEFFDENRFIPSVEFEQILAKKGFKTGAYVPPRRSWADDMEDRAVIRPYDMLRKYHFPILYKEVFHMDRICRMEFDYGDQVSRAVQYIEKDMTYDIRYIYNYLLKNFSPLENRRILNLNYFLDKNTVCASGRSSYGDTAVAMHLFYQDLFLEASAYIRSIPEDIYLFITVKSEDAKKELTGILSYRSNLDIIVSSNVGRDWGALLLDIWPNIKQYTYICFLHDKKTTGGRGYPVVGEAFMELAWESLIGSEAYISQIIELLENTDTLGLLSPVLPYHSGYLKLLGDSWTICMEKTRKLGELLALRTKIDDSSMPFALSGMFWAKREALLPFLEYGFSYEDFPKEPLALDGTFNHALERIITYCAQSQGFFSGTVQGIRSAENHMLNYEYMLERCVRDAMDSFGDISCAELFSGNSYRNRMGLLRFAIENRHIYIYGAGNNGKNVSRFLTRQGVDYEGFIISEGFEKALSFCGHSVFYLNDIEKDAGIVVAVDKRYRQEILSVLDDNAYMNYFVIR